MSKILEIQLEDGIMYFEKQKGITKQDENCLVERK